MKYIIWSAAAIAVLLLASNTASAETTQDHYKDVYYKTPHQVEVCYDKQVSGDKTGDTLKGAILGGVIGNNVGDIKNGDARSVIGGMIGHNNSKGQVVHRLSVEQKHGIQKNVRQCIRIRQSRLCMMVAHIQ